MSTVEANKTGADLIIVSDFHIGEGRQDGFRYSPTEDFFHDEDFDRFLLHITQMYSDDPGRARLILNGDIFDFLTILTMPTEEEAQKRGFQITDAERNFGLNATEQKSIYKLEVIAKGHPRFFSGLSRFVKAGFRVEILRGNHDMELYFDGVREKFLEVLAQVPGGATEEQLAERVTFHHLFYREPGRIHVEHGHQYDGNNSNRYPLNPVFVRRHKWRKDHLEENTLDYPLGSVFVKFFYNRVRRFDPYAPRLVSPEQYMEFIRRYNIFDIWRVYRDHYPYFISAFSPDTNVGAVAPTKKDEAEHEAEMEATAKRLGIDEFFKKWNALKRSPESASRVAVVKKAMKPYVRRMLWGTVFAFGVMYLWILMFLLIQEIPSNTAEAFISSVFAAGSIVAGVWAWGHFRKKTGNWSEARDDLTFESASHLAELSGVPIVVFGHNHRVEQKVIDRRGTLYLNGGTWTQVANPWGRILRNARRLTFVYVKGDDAKLQRWNYDGLRFDEVPMFQEGNEELGPVLIEELGTLEETLEEGKRSLVLGNTGENELFEEENGTEKDLG